MSLKTISRMTSSLLVLSFLSICLALCIAQQSPAASSPGTSTSHHSCNHGHDHFDHNHDHLNEPKDHKRVGGPKKLPEELAEEEDLKLYGFGSDHLHDHHHDHHNLVVAPELSGAGLWIRAMGCSLLVSMASLVCLMIIPVLLVHGKPSKAVVDLLAVFGAGAMLGDAFLHQLPHAFGNEHSHSHDHDHSHQDVSSGHGHSHSHSLEDLYVGLSVLAGLVAFLAVEKLVRYVEEVSGGAHSWGHSHSHHHHKSSKKLKDDSDMDSEVTKQPHDGKTSDGLSDDNLSGKQGGQPASNLRKRNVDAKARDEKPDLNAVTATKGDLSPASPPSSIVFGYLNLISDGVHNFTDGMALGSAFLLYGALGGWSRTLFLLAHELPQEVGDFGILVRSGFSVSQALFFNFLSALVALAGTALALLLGKNPGHSSLIEGFTAGGFIYIAIGGVLAEMNNNGSSGIKSIISQLTALISGMAVAVCISLVE